MKLGFYDNDRSHNQSTSWTYSSTCTYSVTATFLDTVAIAARAHQHVNAQNSGGLRRGLTNRVRRDELSYAPYIYIAIFVRRNS